MRKKIYFFAIAFCLTLTSLAQSLIVQNESCPVSANLNACGASQTFKLKITPSGIDSMSLQLNLYQGVEFTGTYSITGSAIASIQTNNPARPIFKIKNLTSEVIFSYTIKASCSLISGSSINSISDSIYYTSYTGNNPPLTSSLLSCSYNIQSSELVFNVNGSTNLNFSNAFFDTPFTRTFKISNSSLYSFTGDFIFKDSALSAVEILDLEIIHPSGAIKLNSHISGSSAFIKGSVSNVAKDSFIVIRETLKLKGCPGIANSLTFPGFTYGCKSDVNLCKQAPINSTRIDRSSLDRPQVNIVNLSPGIDTVCTSDAKLKRQYLIINTGQGVAKSLTLLLRQVVWAGLTLQT